MIVICVHPYSTSQVFSFIEIIYLLSNFFSFLLILNVFFYLPRYFRYLLYPLIATFWFFLCFCILLILIKNMLMVLFQFGGKINIFHWSCLTRTNFLSLGDNYFYVLSLQSFCKYFWISWCVVILFQISVLFG